MIKKIVLAAVGLSFAFSVTSCKYEGQMVAVEKKSEKVHSEKHHDRW